MTDQFSNMSFQNKGLKGHMFFEVRKSISSTINNNNNNNNNNGIYII